MLTLSRTPLVFSPSGGGSVCDARDVAAAICVAIDRGQSGRNYILAGDNLPYATLWQKMLGVMRRSRPMFPLRNLSRIVGAAIDLGYRIPILKEGDVNGALMRMADLYHYYDSSRATGELEYHRRPLDQTLVESWEWLSVYHRNRFMLQAKMPNSASVSR